jgi:hypothetical protein
MSHYNSILIKDDVAGRGKTAQSVTDVSCVGADRVGERVGVRRGTRRGEAAVHSDADLVVVDAHTSEYRPSSSTGLSRIR